MNEEHEAYHEAFLVCQDSVVATVYVDERDGGWSITVFQVQLPDTSIVHLNRAFGVPGPLAEARSFGTEVALAQIADVLHRGPEGGGSVLRAVPKETAAGAGNFEGYIEAVDGDGFVTDALLVTLVGRHYQTAKEAVEVARRGLARVVNVSAEGKILT
ncbi:hypothetical protein [Stenotrophomonas oahuensis]|uniref:Uncharacterized protein n=1 Tax=Stenotrophomonas oahuensis TaxID=3003271 RepID=A0ABY9YPZ2_9GAMM|nr:hypothetical protein [Stenotrophomonas sp. A5586]WNH52822.1 hypothetical protein PDM29_00695 [Stenotrophomonas sp. A5586]